MAARINTKFVFIVIIVFGTAVAVAGGVWYIKQRTDATRHVRAGDDYAQEGDFRKAAQYYERAVAREPANFDYLAMMENAVLSIRPETADEAGEWYREYISVLQHAAIHGPTNPDYHLRLINELHAAARQSSSWGYTTAVRDAAGEMWQRVTTHDPKRVYAKLYRGMASFSPWMFDRLTQNEIDAGEQDIREFLEEVPDSDMGWAILADGLLGQAERLRESGQGKRSAEKLQQSRDAVVQGFEKVEDGPEVLIQALKLALYDRRLTGEDGDTALIRTQVEELVRLARERMDPWLHTQTASVLARLYWMEDLPDPQALIDDYLAQDPDAHDQRLHKARLFYFNQELDQAEASAREILDAELLPVGYLSQFQFELQRRAASLIVDVEVRRWEVAEMVDRPAARARAQAARDALAALASDPENDALVIRARGKVAFIEKDFSQAAALFNRLVSEAVITDYETLMFAALSLEQQGEIGAAADYLQQALEFQPKSVENLMRLARLRYQMRHYELAGELLERVLALEPKHEIALQLTDQISRAMAPDTTSPTHPVQVALAQARSAMQEGGLDDAYAGLLAAYEVAPDDLSLINALVRVEIEMGLTDDALAHVDHGLGIVPGNRTLLTLKANILNDDPIEAIRQYLAMAYPDDEVGATVETLLSLREVARRQEMIADRYERRRDDENAAIARERAERARAEEQVTLARAQELAPEHPRFIEYQFVTAVEDKDWRRAERVAQVAGDLNLDQADGAMFDGRLLLAQDDAEGAIRAFRRATEEISYSALAWQLLGLAYQRLGNMNEALAALERSYSNNPADLRSALAYGDLLVRTGNRTRALNVFRAARRLAPLNVDLRETWLSLESEYGNAALALQERLTLYEERPDDTVNAAALVRVLGTTDPSRDMLVDADGRERYTEDRWNRLPERGSFSKESIIAEKRELWRAEAEKILDKLKAPGERDLEWHVLRAELLRARGQVQDGVRVLQEFAEQGPPEDRLAMELALGLYFRRVSRTDEAVATFDRARQYQDPETRLADLALAELLFDLQNYAAALPLYESANEAETSRRTVLRIAECMVMLGRFADATERLDAVESQGGRDGTSALLRAAVLSGESAQAWDRGDEGLAERLETEYEETLSLAERLDPTDPTPFVLRARGLFQKYQRTGQRVLLDDALVALSQADEVSPDFYRTSLTRVIVLEEMGNARGALAELTRLVQRSPELDQARQLLVQKLVADERIDAAATLAAEALQINPTSVAWLERLGDLEMTHREDPAAAGEQYEAAVAVLPTERLIAKRASSFLEEEPPRYREAVEFLGRYPAEFESSPVLRGVYARALAASGRRDEVLEQMRIAYQQQRAQINEGEATPASIRTWFAGLRNIFEPEQAAEVEAFATELNGGRPDAYELHSLSNIWRLAGMEGRRRAVVLLKDALEKCPADDARFRSRINSDLGVTLLQLGEIQESLVAFEGILAIEPENSEVLNNIAYLVAERLNDPQRALPYAERALAIEPGSWAILDTVGWIHYRLEELDEAESILRRSAEQEMTATNQLHLAYVYAARGDYRRALRYLAEAAELRPDPETLKEINDLADDIRTRATDG